MSKSKKILNYIAMVCAILSAIVSLIDHNLSAFLWTMVAFIWMFDSHLIEKDYYDQKEELEKLTDNYFNTLIMHGNEVKELKDKIKKLEKENKS